jgi:hypothetical protein
LPFYRFLANFWYTFQYISSTLCKFLGNRRWSSARRGPASSARARKPRARRSGPVRVRTIRISGDGRSGGAGLATERKRKFQNTFHIFLRNGARVRTIRISGDGRSRGAGLATQRKRKFQSTFHIFLRNGARVRTIRISGDGRSRGAGLATERKRKFQNTFLTRLHVYASIVKRPRTNPRRAPSRRGREHRARKIRSAGQGMRRARRRGVHRVLALLGQGATRRTTPSQHR